MKNIILIVLLYPMLCYPQQQDSSLFIATGAASFSWKTPAQVKGVLGLSNVDNTSDQNKPVSSATQTALNAKASLTGSEVITAKTFGMFNFAVDNQANDSYVITLSPAPASLETGMVVIFKAKTANTTGCSINVNGLGAKTIVKRVNTNTATGDILAGMFCLLVYDGTNFVILNPVVN